MSDRETKIKKISSYLTKKSHINYLTIELISYNNKNYYIRFDYVDKVKAYKIVWYDLQFVDLKHLDYYTNIQLVSSFFANRLVELLFGIKAEPGKVIDEQVLGDRVVFTNSINPKEIKQYVFDRFLPLKWASLIDPLALTFSYLPRTMDAFLAEMFAIFDNNTVKYNSTKPIKFSLEKGNIEELFVDKILTKGKKLEDKVTFLEKFNDRYLAIVEDQGYYSVIIDKVTDNFYNMWCSSNNLYLDEYIYATLKCIRDKKINKFYKVRRKTDDNNLLDSVRKGKYYLAFGIDGNDILTVSQNGVITKYPAIENNEVVFEVIEDDDNLSLSKLLENMQ